MKLVKLSGTESTLKLNLENPIHLDDHNYEIALAGFYSDNNIYNLREDSAIYFRKKSEDPYAKLEFSKGYWTINEIQDCLNNHVDPDKEIKIDKLGNRIRITSSFYVAEFEDSMGTLSGFTNTSYLNINYRGAFTAENTPNLRTVDTIEMHCNIVERSIANHNIHWH